MKKFVKYANGLTLVVETIPSSQTSHCAFRFATGIANQKSYEGGVAHFLEHMLAGESSTKHSANELNLAFSQLGSDFDASTYYYDTEYSFECLSENFDSCFELASERLFECKFDEDEIEKEKRVIIEELGIEEIQPSLDNVALQQIYEDQLPFPEVGTSFEINSINKEMLKKFYKREYTTGNLVVSVVGNKSFEEIQDILNAKLFPRIKDLGTSSPKAPELTPSTENLMYSRKSQFKQAEVVIKFPILCNKSMTNLFSASFMSEILGNFSGGLYRRLRFDEPLVYYVGADFDPQTKIFEISFECDSKNVRKCLHGIREELYQLSTQGVNEGTMKSIRALIKKDSIIAFRSLSRLMEINADFATKGKLFDEQEYFELYDKISGEDMREFAKKLYDSKFMVAGQGKITADDLKFFFPGMDPNDQSIKKTRFQKLKNLSFSQKKVAKAENKEKE